MVDDPQAGQSWPKIHDRRASEFSNSDSTRRRGSNQSHYGIQERLNEEGVSLQTLYDLKALLDAECFDFTMQERSIADSAFCNQKLTHIAVRLRFVPKVLISCLK